MSLRIIEAGAGLDQALEALERGLKAWAGGVSDVWRDRGGRFGASYARTEALYLAVERSPEEARVFAALAARDQTLLRLSFDRADPAAARDRWAFAAGEDGAVFLLIAIAALERQGVHDAFRRLAGAAQVKRAVLAGRDYVLLGPLGGPHDGEGLGLVAALHPAAVQAAARDAAEGEGEAEALYPVARSVRREHRAAVKVAAALQARLAAVGFGLDQVEAGPLTADLAFARGEERLAVEILGDADPAALALAVGRLALIAPRAAAFDRLVALPASEMALSQELGPFEGAVEELGLVVALYEFERGEPRFTLRAGASHLADDARDALTA